VLGSEVKSQGSSMKKGGPRQSRVAGECREQMSNDARWQSENITGSGLVPLVNVINHGHAA